MEEGSEWITIKTEVEAEISEDQSIETDSFSGICEEHNYNKIMLNEFYHCPNVQYSFDIKKETEYEETESPSSGFNLEELKQDELMKTNVIAKQEAAIVFNQIKQEDFDWESEKLHHSVEIKEEDDFIEVDDMQEGERNSRKNTQGAETAEEYLKIENFGEVKLQKMPNPSRGNFLKQFVEIGKQRSIESRILKYYTEDKPMIKH